MPNPYFRFKKFTVRHDRSSMKVGTDGVLLGAWADVTGAARVLDVGTGCGVIALMIAQRTPETTVVTGIDIDEMSVCQARENAAASPWAGRVDIIAADVRSYSGGRFDLIVSNPPFHEEDTACPVAARHAARHTDSLSYQELTHAASRLLADDGLLSVVLPADARSRFVAAAINAGLYLTRLTAVHTKPGIPPKRVLMSFSRRQSETREDSLFIEAEDGTFSPDYVSLTKDFYLRF